MLITLNNLSKQWGILQISLNRGMVKGGNDGKRELTHASNTQKGQEYMHRIWRYLVASALHLGTETKLTWRGSLGLYGDNQRTATSLRMWPRGSGAAAPLWKSTQTDGNGQSIQADNWTRWRRASPSSLWRLKKSSDTIKDWLQWQRTKANAWKQLLVQQQESNRSIHKERSSTLKDSKYLEKMKLGSEFPQ